MSEHPSPAWESWLRETASGFAYPPTPDVSKAVRRRLAPRPARTARTGRARRLAWAVAVVLVLLGALLTVPRVRAAVVEFIQVGALRILPVDWFDATPLPPPTAQPRGTAHPALGEPITLAEARARVAFPIRLPTYPEDIGAPDAVYLQALEDAPGEVVVLVWEGGETPPMALYQIGVPYYGVKQAMGERVSSTTVNGDFAVWIEGPHELGVQDGDVLSWRLVPGNVLLWSDEAVTYRLESELSLVEAQAVAEGME